MTEKLLIALAVLLAGFAAGWTTQGWRAEARVQSIIAAQRDRDAQATAALAAAERANTDRLQRAMTAADAAIALAQSRQATAETHAQELRHALETATSRTRQCLSADALRLLNSAPATHPTGPGLRLPQTSGSAAAAPAAPAADPGRSASEHAVAEWIVTAQQQYDTCRARIDALRAWTQQ